MLLKKVFLIVVVLFLITSFSYAQDLVRIEITNNFIKAYNQQNYQGMRTDFHWLMKIVFHKTTFKNWFGKRYFDNGRMLFSTDDIKIRNSKIIFQVSYEKEPFEKEIISFAFTRKNKIIGFGIKRNNFIFLPLNASSDSLEYRIDQIINNCYPEGFNGSVMFCSGDKIMFKKNWGYSDFETKELLNDSTLFELASCSKQFTACAVLKLAELGKLSIDDSIRNFFPLLPYPISIRGLLNHTSGLPDYMPLLLKNKVKNPFCKNDDIINYFIKYKPKLNFTPGEKYEYSNTNYALLASVIEKCSGTSYSDFLKEYFFNPLGMSRSRVYNTRREYNEVLPNYAYGYVLNPRTNTYIIPDSIKEYAKYLAKLDGIVGDGCVNSTLMDLYKWNMGLTENTVLSAKSIEAAYMPGKDNNGNDIPYGFGVEVNSIPGIGKIVSHLGGWPGYQTLIYRFVDTNQMIVILSNKESQNSNILKLAQKVSSFFLDFKVPE